MQPINAPPLSAEAYAHCFLTFRKYSTEWLGMLQWCRDRIADLLPPRPRLCAMSVGAGNGDFDWRLLPMLRSQADRLEYVFVEPSEAMCAHLRERMACALGGGCLRPGGLLLRDLPLAAGLRPGAAHPIASITSRTGSRPYATRPGWPVIRGRC
ncbi:MAG: class I SAM-dependent methyltransferase [Proteobacteria bacterium]|nr:class I SAM-dependent methyltransferase [Pseudomonadota bacterium]MBU4573114.1 class I SAM-dependent methyltransferase [Pseudomonadota bacterium]MBU4600381.1 class I SAM-dependent methyltransferase [Pseudomonadota bacterium]MBV1715682.1 class I SAM-dependent methyltransferase [Desulfarculus sp.]MBV1750462.1 class I SAM-dependent methyltransferase [Desulfarculus sp.]